MPDNLEKVFDRYEMYDTRRDRFTNGGYYSDQKAAEADFCERINRMTKDWKGRDRDRYFLVRLGTLKGHTYTAGEGSVVMSDWQVPFDRQVHYLKDPTHDETADAEFLAYCEAMEAADALYRAQREARNQAEQSASTSSSPVGDRKVA